MTKRLPSPTLTKKDLRLIREMIQADGKLTRDELRKLRNELKKIRVTMPSVMAVVDYNKIIRVPPNMQREGFAKAE